MSLLFKILRKVGKRLVNLRLPALHSTKFLWYLEVIAVLGRIFKWGFKVYVFCVIIIAGAWIFDIPDLKDFIVWIWTKCSNFYIKIIDLFDDDICFYFYILIYFI